MKIYKAGVLLLAFVLLGFGAQSASNASAQEVEIYCPSFGEEVVSISLSTLSPKALAGISLPVAIDFKNETYHPVSGGYVVARLVSRAEDAVFERQVVLEDISLSAQGELSRSFRMKIPNDLPKGVYDIEAVFVSSSASYEDPDAASSQVSGAQRDSISLEVDNTAKNMVFIDTTSAEFSLEDSEVSVVVINDGDRGVTVPVSWKIYKWNSVLEKDVLESKSSLVSIPAQSSKTISYELINKDHSSYKAVASIISGDYTSSHGVSTGPIRGEALVRFAGVTKSAEGFKGYACIHNVFTDDGVSRTVNLSVTDINGTTLVSKNFDLSTSTNKTEFSADVDSTAQDFIVTAQISSHDAVEGSITKIYTCRDLKGCSFAAQNKDDIAADESLIFAITLLAAGLGGLFAIRFGLKKKKTLLPMIPPTPPINTNQ
jgi:hypothetical protein